MTFPLTPRPDSTTIRTSPGQITVTNRGVCPDSGTVFAEVLLLHQWPHTPPGALQWTETDIVMARRAAPVVLRSQPPTDASITRFANLERFAMTHGQPNPFDAAQFRR